MFEEYKNKKILVIGFGLEGKTVFEYLKKQGFSPVFGDTREAEELYRVDPNAKKQELILGQELFDSLHSFDVIIKSPGARLEPELVEKLGLEGKTITSQIEEFFKFCPCPIVGVTGTKGKGTTSTMIFQMLKADGKDAYLGGNIGVPVIDFATKLNKDSYVVLELSSFQLQFLTKSPHIAVVLNTTTEHLDVHKTTMEYREAKKAIVKYQSMNDYAVINEDYEVPKSFAKETKAEVFYVSKEHETNGCYINQYDEVMLADGTVLINASKLQLRGRHNLENVTAAAMAAKLAGVETKTIRTVLENFKGLEHRLEYVREVNGVKFYNDSFSTVPETAIAAIKSFDEPEIIILGGSYKGSDYKGLGEQIAEGNIKAVILIGEMTEEIKKAIPKVYNGQIVLGLEKMEDIVQKAYSLASAGDVILLSPACASFGLFKNYKDRGNQFKEAVSLLK